MTPNTLTVVLSVATVVLGIAFASYAARVCRGAHDVARSMGASGTDIRKIARRTRLPQDVVSMLLAVPAALRQNVPASAGTARRTRLAPVRNPATPVQASAQAAVAARTSPAPKAPGAPRGTEVATA
jgi:hypothetical protein